MSRKIDPVDAITEGEVEQLMDGRYLWMPYGLTGKGFVVQSKEELRHLRRYDALWIGFSVLFIGMLAATHDVWAAIGVAVFSLVMRVVSIKQIGRRMVSFQS